MDLKKTTEKDLNKMLSDKRAELREFRFGLSGSKTTNVKKGRGLKKEIARVLTELNNR
ncbi:MAG: 50S ribosomal protein L29 [Candidatus Pacebacteria bacterium]|nr:50S ribosomal protein L29 [Candidatus Paceibacterota bacterium]